MVLFASVDTGFAILVKKFLDGAFVERDPRMLVLVPVGIVVLFLVRGVGDYLSVYAPGWVGPAGDQVDPARPVRALPAAAGRRSSTRTASRSCCRA